MSDLARTSSGADLFISYRREDAGQIVSRLIAALAPSIRKESIFYDRESLQAGDRWKERLGDEIAGCRAFLALIGSRWLKERNEASGQRRLDEPEDWVRTEIEQALAHPGAHGLVVVPVLIDGAPMPKREFLPPSVAGLTDHQGVQLRTATNEEWESDVTHLLQVLQDKGIVAAARLATHMTARITVRHNGPAGAPLFDGHTALVRIGRDPSSEIVLDQPASWEHGRITLLGGVYVYQHLGQRGAVIRHANGRRVQLSRPAEEPLRQLDVIELTESARLSVQFQLPAATGYSPTK